MTRHDQRRRTQALRARPLQHFEPRAVGHNDVEQPSIEARLAEQLLGRLGAIDRVDVVIPQCASERSTHQVVVFQQQKTKTLPFCGASRFLHRPTHPREQYTQSTDAACLSGRFHPAGVKFRVERHDCHDRCIPLGRDEVPTLRGLFDPSVVLLSGGVQDDLVSTLQPAELTLVARALPKRQNEFATGRALAHLALEQLGVGIEALLNDEQRAPIWPSGIRGSITHCNTRVLVAVCRAEHGSVGVDVEHRRELKRDLWESVFLPSELAALDALPEPQRGRMALILFSAKESLYKAQFPISRTYMGFRALEVQARDGELTCTWQEPIPPFDRGAIARGRYFSAAPPMGEVLTGVQIPARCDVGVFRAGVIQSKCGFEVPRCHRLRARALVPSDGLRERSRRQSAQRRRRP